MSDPARLEEEGDKALRLGLCRWSKDYTLAAIKYEQAVGLYKAADRHDKAVGVYEKLIEVNRFLKDNWAVGRAYEGLIDCSFLRDHEELNIAKTLELCDAAASCFALESSLNSFLTAIDKLARFAQQTFRARREDGRLRNHLRAHLLLPLQV